MSDDTDQTIETDRTRILPLLQKNRWAAWAFVVTTLALAIGSGVVFVVQVCLGTNPNSVYSGDRSWNWIHMLGYLVRAFIFSWLAIAMMRYLRQLRRLSRGVDVTVENLFKAVSGGIGAMGWCGIILLCLIAVQMTDWLFGFSPITFPQRLLPPRISLPSGPPVQVAFHEAQFTETAGWIRSSMPIQRTMNEPVYLNKEPIIQTEDILEARASVDATGVPALVLTFTDTGSKKLAAATAKLINKHVAIVIDDEVLSVPIVRTPLSTSLMLTGNLTDDRAREIADSINRNRKED